MHFFGLTIKTVGEAETGNASRLQTHQDDGIGAKTEAAPSRFCITTLIRLSP
jgi:hypothetical protein